MTLDLLYGMGVPIREDGEEVFIPPFTFPEQRLHVEGDHSSAAFWYEYLALKGKGAVFLEGIRSTSSQGDRELPRFFDQLGVSESWEEEGCWVEAIPGQVDDEAYEAEMRDHPDLVPALVGALAGLGKKGVLNGVGSLRFKESDRIQALSDELAKVGVELRSEGELLGVDPSGFDPEATPNFASHNDHRIVMALAPLAAILPYCSIEDPEVVRKSYPGFWDDLHRLDPSVFPPDQKDPRS